MLKPPKSAEVNTHNAKVRFLVKLTNFTNNLETRMDIQRACIEQLQRDVINLVASKPKPKPKPKSKGVAASVKTKTKNKETKNEE